MLLIFFTIQAKGNSLVIMPMKMQPQPNQAKRLSCSPAREPTRASLTGNRIWLYSGIKLVSSLWMRFTRLEKCYETMEWMGRGNHQRSPLSRGYYLSPAYCWSWHAISRCNPGRGCSARPSFQATSSPTHFARSPGTDRPCAGAKLAGLDCSS